MTAPAGLPGAAPSRRFRTIVAARARRHDVCFGPGMALPYPFETETGQLKPRSPEPRVTFDVEASIADAIRASGSNLEIFGASYTLDDASAANAVAEYYRNAVMLHFNERVGAPDAALWQEFADQARDQLERHPYLDGDVLDALRLTIDNL